MAEDPLKPIEQIDPTLPKLVGEIGDLAFKEGAIPSKYKYLIALALDASHGDIEGVTALAQAAIKAGATKEEIVEAVRVTHFVSGGGGIYTAAKGLKDIL